MFDILSFVFSPYKNLVFYESVDIAVNQQVI